MSPIDDKWQQTHLVSRAPVDTGCGSDEMAMPDDRAAATTDEHGSIYWTPEHGAFEVHGDIRVKWAQVGGHGGFLGYRDRRARLRARGRAVQPLRGWLYLLARGHRGARGAR